MIKSILNKICIRIYEKGKFLSQKNKYNSYRKKYNISECFNFNGIHILLHGDGNINFGHNSYIGDFSTVQSAKDCFISIGNNCSISHNVRIYTETKIADQDFSISNKKKSGNVSIGNFVWIGANVFINPGVCIGDNAVIGSNSVVTKDIPPFTIVGGVPAGIIRKKKLNA